MEKNTFTMMPKMKKEVFGLVVAIRWASVIMAGTFHVANGQ
jgi:hypothetical protein